MLRIFVRKYVIHEIPKRITRFNVIRTLSITCTRQTCKKNRSSLFTSTNVLKCSVVNHPIRLFSTLPPHKKIKLPALSPTMETGNIVNWAKKEGEKLNEGDVLADIETDKATMSFETPETGYLAKILIPAGTKGIPLGKLVCIIVDTPEDVAKFKDYKDDGSSDAAVATRAPAASGPSAPPPIAASSVDAPHMKINLPALSPTMEVGTIVSWGKKEGDKLSEGDLLAEIETDKATMSFETPETGYLAKILIPAGTKQVPVGKLVCIIVPNQADVAKFKNFQDGGAAVGQAPSGPPSRQSSAPAASSGGRVYASPMAKRLAEQRNIRLQGKGSGLYGSITSRDLPAAGAAAPSVRAVSPSVGASAPVRRSTSPSPERQIPVAAKGAKYVDIPLTNMRQTIAKRLVESKTTIPHFYLTIECNIDKLLLTRARLNKAYEKEKVKVSINDFIIKAMALANRKMPECNAQWMGTFIRRFSNIDVSVAVATDTGLITPIVFNADSKGLIAISEDVKKLATKARKGTLKPEEFVGGTITLSNLGMFDTDMFSAVINPPQCCIISVGSIQKKLVLDAKSEKGFKEVQSMYFTLSGDHRVIDGAIGALWLQVLKKYIQDPETMLM